MRRVPAAQHHLVLGSRQGAAEVVHELVDSGPARKSFAEARQLHARPPRSPCSKECLVWPAGATGAPRHPWRRHPRHIPVPCTTGRGRPKIAPMFSFEPWVWVVVVIGCLSIGIGK